MKIRRGNWKIDTKSLVRIEFKNYIPRIVIKKKFQKYVKWTLRLLSFVGIATAFLTFDYITGIIITLTIFIVEQFFERTIFEYTVFYFPEFPEFDIEYEQWLSTGYYLLSDDERYQLLDGFLNFIGPLYEKKEYAEKFFSFIKSWNNGENTDPNNRINISIIHEENNKYTMYLYPNYSQETLDKYFAKYKGSLALEKFGKQQQELVMHFVFWHRNLTKGNFFHRFIEDFQVSKTFYFVPFYLKDEQPIPIDELRIKKNHIKIKSRVDLEPNEIEYIYK